MADQDLKKNVKTAWWQPAIMMFLKLSVWIAVPIIVALYLGEWLDKKYNSAPWIFLVCIGLAFTISMIGLVSNTIKELKKIDKK
ncbi:MAG: AtpZ/AtpI family protein [Patescibacteria group bacterium]|jgi:F0F1-type ATP synthase assembly protein I